MDRRDFIAAGSALALPLAALDSFLEFVTIAMHCIAQGQAAGFAGIADLANEIAQQAATDKVPTLQFGVTKERLWLPICPTSSASTVRRPRW